MDRILASIANEANHQLNYASLAFLRVIASRPKLLDRFNRLDDGDHALVDCFQVAYLESGSEAAEQAHTIWKDVVASDASEALRTKALDRLRDRFSDADSVYSFDALFDAIEQLQLPRSVVFEALFPTSESMMDLLNRTAFTNTSPEMVVLDPLVPMQTASAASIPSVSAYARAVVAAARLLSEDRSRITEASWILPHVMRIGILAKDKLALKGSAKAILGSLSMSEATTIASVCDALSVSVVSFLCETIDAGWHAETVEALRGRKAPATALATMLVSLQGQSPSASIDARVFRRLLSSILRSLDSASDDAIAWLPLIHAWQKIGERAISAQFGGSADILQTRALR